MATDTKNKIFKAEDFDKEKPSSKKPWWPWVLGAVIVCSGLTFLLTRGNSTNSSEVVQPVVSDVDTMVIQIDTTIVAQDTLVDTTLAGQGQTDQNDTPEMGLDKPDVPNQGQGTAKTTPTTKPNSVTVNTNSLSAGGNVEEEAWRTIRGDYGNGVARKEALGSRYDEIQDRVNAIYRERNLQ